MNLQKRMLLWLIPVLLGATCPHDAWSRGAVHSNLPVVMYKTNETNPVYSYRNNALTIARWSALLSDPDFVGFSDSIYIVATSSPEGSLEVNTRLAELRTRKICNYVLRQNTRLDPSRIVGRSQVSLWSDLLPWVEQDPHVPHREQVLQILELPIAESSKATQLGLLGQGEAYAYLDKTYVPHLRYARLEVHEASRDTVSRPEPVPYTIPQIPQISELPTTQHAMATGKVDSVRLLFYQAFETYTPKPLFALKTNLLADLVTALNLEIEVPIGRRWSIAVEGMFPWWLWGNRQYCFQMFSGHLEGRYWFADWSNQPTLTGWFVGVYGGYGFYDMEWSSQGVQGEFRNFGISGGYAHRIGRNLSMEYSLGVGYMQNNYRTYRPEWQADDWHLIYQETKKHDWFGPTRVKVSLVWMLNHGKQKAKHTF